MNHEIVITQQSEETEQQLVERIKNMNSQTAWSVGAMISRLKHDHGLTDEQIASRTELSREVVTQRRTVWESFGDCNSSYKLSWTHFREAVAWDDAPECLQWADEMQASVAEMKAWRRSQHGEDLTEQEEYAPWSEQGPPTERETPLDVAAEETPKQHSSNIRATFEQPRTVAQEKPADARRDESSQVSRIYDGLEQSIQMLRDYQKLQKHRQMTENLLEIINEQIAKVKKVES